MAQDLIPSQSQFLLYTSPKGEVKVDVVFQDESIWLSQKKMAELFGVNRTVITKHLKNIFLGNELTAHSVSAIFAHTAEDGKIYQANFYNLDAIIAVGYRVNSYEATQFRIWATQILKQHILAGYTLNSARIAVNYEQFLKSIDNIKALLPSTSGIVSNDVIELITIFAGTWLSLDAYDTQTFPRTGATPSEVTVSAEDLIVAIQRLKKELIHKQQATSLFGSEKRVGALEGIVGNIFQTIGGQDVYSTVEEKAAHLLYFMVKNHPFNDGNKRSGAFAFVWFLKKFAVLPQGLTPLALTTLTLLIAESHPDDKDKMVGLVLLLLPQGVN